MLQELVEHIGGESAEEYKPYIYEKKKVSE